MVPKMTLAFNILARGEHDWGLMALCEERAACGEWPAPETVGDYMAWLIDERQLMVDGAIDARTAAKIAYIDELVTQLEKLGFHASALPWNSPMLYSIIDGKEGEKLIFEFNRDDAQGKIIIEPSGPGLSIWSPAVSTDVPIAIIDLWHSSEDGQAEEPELDTIEKMGGGKCKVMVVVGDPRTDDPIAYVQYWPERTLIEFEMSTEKHGTSENGTPIMGLKF